MIQVMYADSTKVVVRIVPVVSATTIAYQLEQVCNHPITCTNGSEQTLSIQHTEEAGTIGRYLRSLYS